MFMVSSRVEEYIGIKRINCINQKGRESISIHIVEHMISMENSIYSDLHADLGKQFLS